MRPMHAGTGRRAMVCECCGNDDASYCVCADCLPPLDCDHGNGEAV